MENQSMLSKLSMLGEMLYHRIGKLNDSLEVINVVNKILITNRNDRVSIRYNSNRGDISIDVEGNKVYDFYLRLLSRDVNNVVAEGIGVPLYISDWLDIERTEVMNILKQIESELNNDKLKYISLGTDRVNVKYYNGILLLEDKQEIFLRNVVAYKDVMQQCF